MPLVFKLLRGLGDGSLLDAAREQARDFLLTLLRTQIALGCRLLQRLQDSAWVRDRVKQSIERKLHELSQQPQPLADDGALSQCLLSFVCGARTVRTFSLHLKPRMSYARRASSVDSPRAAAASRGDATTAAASMAEAMQAAPESEPTATTDVTIDGVQMLDAVATNPADEYLREHRFVRCMPQMGDWLVHNLPMWLKAQLPFQVDETYNPPEVSADPRRWLKFKVDLDLSIGFGDAKEGDGSWRRGTLRVVLLGGSGLLAADSNGLSDPYVILQAGRCKAKSRTIRKTLDPVWNEEFEFSGVQRELVSISISVLD